MAAPANANPSLKDVKCYYFNPFLVNNKDKVGEFLLTKENGSAHIYDKNTLLININDSIKTIDISSINTQQFLSSASLADVETDCLNYLDKFSALNIFKNYDLQYLNPGDSIEVPYNSADQRIMCFVATDRAITSHLYFDHVIYIKPIESSDIKVLTYLNKHAHGLVHSSDIGALLHHVKAPDLTNDKIFVLTVCGYNKNPLRRFIQQRPFFVIPNHETETLYIITVPLEQAVIHDATLVGLVVGKRHDNVIRYTLMPTPFQVDDVNTGQLNYEVISNMTQACDSSLPILMDPIVNTIREDPKISESDVQISIDNATKESTERKTSTVIFVENGIDISDIEQNTVVGDVLFGQFGSGIEYFEQFNKKESDEVNLPIAFGETSGVAALALGRLTGSSMVKFEHGICHISDNWLDTVKPACLKSMNGLFVIHPRDQTIDASTKSIRETFLNGLCVNGLVLAGSYSIVLVKIQDKYYFYKGVSWGTEYTFGQEVDYLSVVEEMKAINLGIVDTKDNSIRFHNDRLSVPDFKEYLMSTTSMEELEKNRIAVLNALYQITIVCNPEEIKQFSDSLVERIMSVRDAILKPYIDELIASLGTDSMKEKRLILADKKRNVNRAIQWLVNGIGDLTSTKGSSTRKQNIARLARQTTIRNNVQRATTMTVQEKCELLDKYCENHGVLIADINPTVLRLCLGAVGSMNQTDMGRITDINGNVLTEDGTSIASLNQRMPSLDSLTYGVMLENMPAGINHALTGNNSIAIPQSFNGHLSALPALPFLICDKYVNADDPSVFFWPEECNQEVVSIFRILTRGTISQATASREFNIRPSNGYLGRMLVHVILSVMENMTSSVNIENIEFDDTVPQLMRGLFGQLMTQLAAGTNVLSTTFQMFNKGRCITKVKDGDLWIVRRMLKVYPYTKWESNNIYDNAKTVVIKAVGSSMTKLTEPMRKQKTVAKKESGNAYMRSRNAELEFMSIAIPVIVETHTDKDALEAACKKLCKYATTDVTGKILNATNTFSTLVEFVRNPNYDNVQNVLQLCLQAHIKRSAHFAPIKQQILDAIKSEDKSRILEAIRILKNSIKELENEYDATCKKIQNRKSIKSRDGGKLAGDAEFKRVPWSVTKDCLDHIERQAKIDECLGHDAGAAAADGTMTTKEIAEVVYENPLIKKLSSVRGADKTIEFLMSFDDTSFEEVMSTVMSKTVYVNTMEIMGALGYNDTDRIVILRDIIDCCLASWDNIHDSESKSFECFK